MLFQMMKTIRADERELRQLRKIEKKIELTIIPEISRVKVCVFTSNLFSALRFFT